MRQKKQKAVLYDLSKIKAERMTPMVTRKMIVGKKEMLGYLFAKKGAVASPHRHVSEQITIILKGAEKFTINDQDIVVHQGQILVIPPNLEHAGEALEDTIELNCFSPLRQDWLSGDLSYLESGPHERTSSP